MMPNGGYLYYLFHTNQGRTALREKLVTPEQIAAMPDVNYLWQLFVNNAGNGLVALRERLITPEQVAAMNADYLSHLFSDNGISALQEKLITLEQAVKMPDEVYLHFLLRPRTDANPLGEKLITPEQAASMHPTYLAMLLSEKGIVLLRNGSITPDQAAAMPSANALETEMMAKWSSYSSSFKK
jgi:hypothetical protein